MEAAMTCKRDGKPMYLVEESEKMSDGTRRITLYYKCPVCGYRVELEQLVINVDRGNITVKRFIRLK